MVRLDTCGYAQKKPLPISNVNISIQLQRMCTVASIKICDFLKFASFSIEINANCTISSHSISIASLIIYLNNDNLQINRISFQDLIILKLYEFFHLFIKDLNKKTNLDILHKHRGTLEHVFIAAQPKMTAGISLNVLYAIHCNRFL